MKKLKNVGWGLFFVIAAALIILNQTGVLIGLSLWSLILGLLLIPVFVTSIVHRNFAGILFPVAFWSILYAQPLGIEKFTPWPVLCAALFLSIGLSLIFPKKHWWKEHEKEWKHDNSEDWIEENIDGDYIKINNRFSGASKYINSEDFKGCEINSSFGGMKVYFDNATIIGNSATVKLDVEFSGVELFVPKEWNVDIQANNRLGGIDEKGNVGAVKNGKVLKLVGNVSFGGITIRYV